MNEPGELRTAAREIFDDALAAVDARRAVLHAVEFEGATLRVGEARFELRGDAPKVYSVALGKAAAAMASALDERLGEALAAGVLTAPRSGFKLSERWRVYEGGHPLPNAESFAAARAAFELLRAADDPAVLFVFLVSGGGSAMLELPRDESLTLEELREANRVLVSCGAPIDQVNAVRRALSAVKGGGLAAHAPHAAQATLVISDVGRGRAYDVASGPTLDAPTDSPGVTQIVERYGLTSKLPAHVLRALEEADAHSPARTPPEARRTFDVLLDNESACEAAMRAARARGLAVEYAHDIVEQHVEDGAAQLVSRLWSLYARESTAGGRGVCLISGGEFSCPVRGGGTGGRNCETALRVAFELEKVLAGRGADAGLTPKHAVALCAGTDGIDGNSPAAGALADETTIERTHAQGLDARKFLDESDSYTLFHQLGDAVVTGPTGTNVRDVRVLIAV
ncbi:MAG: glycerate kinase [Pyrinomonadaceae bacterium]